MPPNFCILLVDSNKLFNISYNLDLNCNRSRQSVNFHSCTTGLMIPKVFTIDAIEYRKVRGHIR